MKMRRCGILQMRIVSNVRMHAARVLAAALLTTSAIGCAAEATDIEAEDVCAEYHVQICDPQESATDRVCPPDVEYVRQCVRDDDGVPGWSSCYCDGPETEDEPNTEPEGEPECPTTPDGQIYENVTCGPGVPDHCPCVPSGGSTCGPGTGSCTAACEVLHERRSLSRGPDIFRHSHATQILLVTSTTTLSVGVPTHVLVTYDGASLGSGVSMFFDGVLDTPLSTQDGIGAPAALDDAWTLGNRLSGGDGLDGLLANVRAWDRVLSSGEAAHVASDNPFPGPGVQKVEFPVPDRSCGIGDDGELAGPAYAMAARAQRDSDLRLVGPLVDEVCAPSSWADDSAWVTIDDSDIRLYWHMEFEADAILIMPQAADPFGASRRMPATQRPTGPRARDLAWS